MAREYVECDVEIEAKTRDAVKVNNYDHCVGQWIPFSAIEKCNTDPYVELEVGETVRLSVEVGFAKKVRLI